VCAIGVGPSIWSQKSSELTNRPQNFARFFNYSNILIMSLTSLLCYIKTTIIDNTINNNNLNYVYAYVGSYLDNRI
jgi:hypothetical protein